MREGHPRLREGHMRLVLHVLLMQVCYPRPREDHVLMGRVCIVDHP